MNKEALIKIILNDLSEVETLVKSFQGHEEIAPAFIDLTEQKLSHIKSEFSLLKTLCNSPSVSVQTQKAEENIQKEIEEVDKPVVPEQKIKQETIIEETPQVTPVTEKPVEEPEKEPDVEQIIPDNKAEATKQEIASGETEVKKEEKKTVPVTEKKKYEDSPKTLGESFVGEKKSVNDKIASSQEGQTKKPLMGKPIDDLTKGLGINDRFMFQRELFNGNSELMQQTLLQLNEIPDFVSAQSFINSNFNWDEEQDATQSFFNYIKRKY
ncbi:hypothetical protein E9993_10485 [Labilibacter sediminis]|nr:hypothetical protein E9993_10485 [Labilibacter sediminis]